MRIDFHASERASLGVEMELELVDATTRQLTSRATPLLEALAEGAGSSYPKAKYELLESTIEIITGVCSTVAEARADLEATLADVAREATRLHVELLCAGTHPFSHYRDQQVAPDERYHRLVAEMRWMAERLQIFGVHVHVGVRSAEKAIAIAGALAAYIPHFLALSASSPFWIGMDTGLASSRSKVFEGLPTAGVPLPMADWAEFEEFMTTLICSGSIGSVREVWWDIRPHPDFGTVELRICDGLPRLSEVA
ncbi:MAG TPA: YbdK family carboxylate-amine ligase, partial [Acidimicrobiales bacterium]|nr:YbdK family carboxylate-amine ligase [Acidimicrobiales bacterium]